MGDTKTTYYVFKFKSNLPDIQRAKDAGGSFFMDWNDIKFNPHDRGGVRQYFNRPTATMKKFDIHVTTLNAGIKSHEPHTHKAEEIILMMEGNAEEEIGDAVKKSTTGDLIYLESMIPHAIKNMDAQTNYVLCALSGSELYNFTNKAYFHIVSLNVKLSLGTLLLFYKEVAVLK